MPPAETMSYLHKYFGAINAALESTEVTRNGTPVKLAAALDQLITLSQEVKSNRGTKYFCGNGASAAMASHFALDWLKAADLKAIAFNDPVSLTAVANDVSFEQVFSLPLSRLAEKKDLVVTISSSGNSPSVVAAIAEAHRLRVPCVTFSGFRPDNQSRQNGDLNFYVPCRTYGVAESCHQILLHAWLDHYLRLSEWS